MIRSHFWKELFQYIIRCKQIRKYQSSRFEHPGCQTCVTLQMLTTTPALSSVGWSFLQPSPYLFHDLAVCWGQLPASSVFRTFQFPPHVFWTFWFYHAWSWPLLILCSHILTIALVNFSCYHQVYIDCFLLIETSSHRIFLMLPTLL